MSELDCRRCGYAKDGNGDDIAQTSHSRSRRQRHRHGGMWINRMRWKWKQRS